MQIATLTYVSGTTPIHCCDARVKIAALLAFSIGIFLVRTWWGMGALAAAAVTAIAVARLPFGRVNRLLIPVYVLAAFSVAFNVLAAPTLDGLLAGLFLGARMIALVAGSLAVCLTTSSSALIGAFRWYIGPLRRVRVPVDDIALTLALSVRFIPAIEQELMTVRAAQRSRGAELAGSLPAKLRIWGAAFSAVFVGLFRHADALATAMDARCYGLKSEQKAEERSHERSSVPCPH